MMMNRKIIVTGSTGMVGSHLVAELIGAGYSNILLIVRDKKRVGSIKRTLKEQNRQWDDNKISVVEGELNDPTLLLELFKGADMLFHAAAAVTLSEKESEIVGINVEMTQHIVDACLRNRVRRLIFVSSIITLGEAMPGEKLIDERSTMESTANKSPYARSKFLSENQVARGGAEGLETVIVNPSTIIGLTDRDSGSAPIVSMLSSGAGVYTDGTIGLVYVNDVARAMVLLAQEQRANGERFILSAENINLRDLIGITNRIVGRGSAKFRLRRWMLRLAASVSSAFTSGKSPLSQNAVKAITSHSYYNGEKVKEFIDFEYTPISEALKIVILKYRERKNG